MKMGYISHRHVKKQMALQNEVIYRVLVMRLFSKVVKCEEKPEGPGAGHITTRRGEG